MTMDLNKHGAGISPAPTFPPLLKEGTYDGSRNIGSLWRNNMNKKTIAILTLVALALSVVAVCGVGYGDSDAATTFDEDHTILISSAEDLINIYDYGDAMSKGEAYYFKLTADITFENTDDWKYVDGPTRSLVLYLCGTFDGNGHKLTITNDSGSYNPLFMYSKGTTIVKDLTLNITGSIVNLFYVTYNTTTIQDIIIEDWSDTCGANGSPFVSHAFGKITFDGCINYASWENTSYGAIFLGGYTNTNVLQKVTFKNCINYGDLTGSNVALFVGNHTNGKVSKMVFLEKDGTSTNKNYGTIEGTMTAGLFACFDKAGAYSTLNTESNYKAINGTTTIGSVEKTGSITALDSLVDSDYTVDQTSGTKITANNGSTSYMLTYKAYANYYDETSFGTHLVSIASAVTTSGTKCELEPHIFVDTEKAVGIYKLNLSDITYTKADGFEYAIVADDDGTKYYVIKSNYLGFSLNATPTVHLTLYNKDDKVSKAGTISLDIDGELKTGYKIVPYIPDVISIDPASNVITEGDFTFTLSSTKQDVTLIVKAYKSTGFDTVDVSESDGVYTIASPKSDIRLEVTAMFPVECESLEHADQTNKATSVKYNEPYSNVISAQEGYSITVTAKMGDQNITVDKGVISIPHVTDKIVITVTATEFTSGTTEDVVVIGGVESDRTITKENGTTTTVIESEGASTTVVEGSGSTTIESTVSGSGDIDGSINQVIEQMNNATTVSNADSVNITVEIDSSTTIGITIGSSTVGSMGTANASLSIVNDNGLKIQFDQDVVSGMAGGDLTVSVGDATALTGAQTSTIGDNRAISLEANVGSSALHELNGTATVSIPMDLNADDTVNVYYVADNGVKELVRSSYSNGILDIFTTHFSVYMISVETAETPEITVPDEEEEFPFFPWNGNNQGSSTTTETDTSDDNTTTIAAAAVVLVIIIAACAMMIVRKN